ncbi:MAG: (Fe-S)-binding protein [Candidatus Jordarchaeaceae archaeon]
MHELKNLKKYREAALSCVACGQCRNPFWPSKGRFGVCPVYETDFTPRFEPFFSRGKNTILRGLLWNELSLSQDLADIFFQCTVCGACEEFCHNAQNPNIDFATHRWIENVKVYEALRADLVEAGFVLREHQEMNSALVKLDNPYGRERAEKLGWTRDLDFKVKDASKSPVEYLYYVGCTSALSLSTQIIAKATAKILNKLGVAFGILGEMEVCCGSVAKRTGNLKAFGQAVEKNVKMFQDLGIKKIITSCAGCYRTFINDYENKLEGIKVIHTVEFLTDFFRDKPDKLKKLDVITTYHDPCHLGRHCGLYDPPRELLKQISNFREMKRIRENAMCCGAGGGVKKAFPELALEMAKNRIKEAEQTQATYLISTCPFCHRNLLDAIQALKSKIEMHDLSELILQSLK